MGAAAGAGAARGDEPTTYTPHRGGPQREPELLTHAHQPAVRDGYDQHGDDHYRDEYDEYDNDDRADDADADEPPTGGRRSRRIAAAGTGPGRDAKAKKGKRGWRIVRRVVVVGVLLGILVPVGAFLVGWVMYDVPSPAALAAEREQVTIITAADGVSEIARLTPQDGNRVDVRIDDVPEHVQQAVLAAEDRSFFSNPGFDIMGIGRAVFNQATGGVGGGSTITQQYVKVATGQDDYSLFRKYREVILAAKMTKERTKPQILEDYLNTIYFGRGAYGIQAASQAYFGKNVQDLTVDEGALLAGVIQAPSRWDPAKNPDRANFRVNFVLDGMVTEGWLDVGERAGLGRMGTPVAIDPALATPQSVGDERRHIQVQVLNELAAQGITEETLAVSGGRIVTTIDPVAQQAARDAVVEGLDGEPENLHSSLVAIDPRTGAVIAYYGGPNGLGLDMANGNARSAGSSFKPFAILAALEQGISIDSVYDGESSLEIDGRVYRNSESDGYGAITLTDAMTRSVNTTFIQLTSELGAQAVREAAYQAGIPERIDDAPSLAEPDGFSGLGISLGQYPVHTLDMAASFGTFAADGVRHAPYFVQSYTDGAGNVDFEHADDPVQAFDPSDEDRNTQLARNVTASMREVADAAGLELDGGREVASKTGTHQRTEDGGDNAAAWMVGYTPQISAAVWIGDPANTAIIDSRGRNIYGRMLPGEIWQQFMNDYLADKEEMTFPDYEPMGETGGPAAQEAAEEQASSSAPPPPPSSEVPVPSDSVEPDPSVEPTEPENPGDGDGPPCNIFGCPDPDPGDQPGPGDGDQQNQGRREP